MKVHEHKWEIVRVVNYAPVREGGHISFTVLKCSCRVSTVFPPENFSLTIKEYQDEFKRIVGKDGFRFQFEV